MKDFETVSTEAMRAAGLRVTQQRLAVIKCIGKAKSPLSAPEIFKKLASKGKSAPLDKVSVYRVLDTLLDLRLVHKVSPDGSYLACNHHHCDHSHHVMSRCTTCDSVAELDVPNEVVAPLLFYMQDTFQFNPDSHLLHMDGVCQKCKAS